MTLLPRRSTSSKPIRRPTALRRVSLLRRSFPYFVPWFALGITVLAGELPFVPYNGVYFAVTFRIAVPAIKSPGLASGLHDTRPPYQITGAGALAPSFFRYSRDPFYTRTHPSRCRTLSRLIDSPRADV